MRQRVLVWFAVLAAGLVVFAAPASAASASTNTTASDFQSAQTFDNFHVVGSSQSAQAVSWVQDDYTTGGFTVDNTFTTNGFYGLYFTLNQPTDEVSATVMSGVTQTEVELWEDGSVVATKSTTGGGDVVNFSHDFKTGVEYVLIAGADTNQYTAAQAESATPSIDEGVINITGGYGSLDDSDILVFDSVTAVYPDSSTYEGDKHDVIDADRLTADIEVENADVTLEAVDGSGSVVDSTTVSSDGKYALDISASASPTHYLRASVSGSPGDSVVRINSESVASSPELSGLDPADGTDTESYDGDVSVNVSDPDFQTIEGDSVVVTATHSNGTQIGQTTVNSNTTVTFTYRAMAGDNEIVWDASDNYSTPDAILTQQFDTPAELRIENASSVGTLIGSGATVTITAYGDQEAVEKTTTDGTVNMSGFPLDQRLVIQSSADGYNDRRIILEGLYSQRTIYMVPTTETTSEVEYVLEDNSGQYPTESTELLVSKPVTVNGSTTYQRVAGDDFGASGSVTFTLTEGDRYRLRIRNSDGDQRLMGSYTVTGDAIEPLRITGVGISPPDSQGYMARIEVDDSGPQRQATFRYVDEDDQTDELHVEIYERGNESNVAFEDDVTGDSIQNYSGYATLENGTQYQVNWSAQRGGETIGATRPVGGVDLGIDIPLDSQWLGTIGFVMLGFLAALGGERYGTQIAVVVVAFSGVLMGLRAVEIYPPFWWGALLIALGMHVAKKQQPGGI